MKIVEFANSVHVYPDEVAHTDISYLIFATHIVSVVKQGWSHGAMVLDELPVPGRPANLDHSRARASAFAVGVGWGGLDVFSLIYHFSSFSLSLGDGPTKTEILSQGR